MVAQPIAVLPLRLTLVLLAALRQMVAPLFQLRAYLVLGLLLLVEPARRQAPTLAVGQRQRAQAQQVLQEERVLQV